MKPFLRPALTEHEAKKFTKGTVERVLTNPFYGGQFLWKGEVYEGRHEIFVPLEWVKAADSRRGKAHNVGSHGTFSHLMTCAVPECGCMVIYDPKIKINKTENIQRLYPYYHGSDAKRLHKNQKIRQVNLSENRLWELFSEPI